MNFMELGLALLLVAAVSVHQFARSGKTTAGGKLVDVFHNDRSGRSNFLPWRQTGVCRETCARRFFSHTLNTTERLATAASAVASRFVSALSSANAGPRLAAVLIAAASLCLSGCAGSGVAAKAVDFYTQNYASEAGIEAGSDGQPTAYLRFKREPKPRLSDAEIQALMGHFAEYAKAGKAVVPQEASK